MLQQERPHDFVIATGLTMSLEEFVQVAFAQAGLNWRHYVEQDPALFRPTNLAVGRADPTKAHRELGWKAIKTGVDVVKKCTN